MSTSVTAVLSNLSIQPGATSCGPRVNGYHRGQTIRTFDNSYTYIKGVYLYIDDITLNPGTLNLEVSPSTNGWPDLANRIANVTMSQGDVSATSYNYFGFTAGSYPQLTAGGVYHITWNADSDDASNWYDGCYDTPTGYENGTAQYAIDGNRLNWQAPGNESTLAMKIIIEFSTTDGSPPTSNFTITAKDISGTSITNYSATINGTNYTTTSGTISTPILASSGNVNITIYDALDSNGYFYNHTYLEIDTSSNWVATNLYQAEYTINATELFTNNPILGIYHSPYNSTSGTVYLLSEGTNITFENTSYYNKTTEYTPSPLNNISFTMTGIYDLQITIKFNESCPNCTPAYNTPITNGQINVTNIEVSNITSYSTATQPITYNGLKGNNTLNAIADIDGIGIIKQNTTTIEINTTTYTWEPFLYPNVLTLTFKYLNETLALINGTLTQLSILNTSYSFNQTNFYLVTRSLTNGQINVIMGLYNGSNHTQYYEYINTGGSISETIYMLEQADHSAWIQVTDLAGVPIEGATVEMYQVERTLDSWTNRYFIGKRLTDSNGKTFFFLDSNKNSQYVISKSGYGPETKSKNFEDYGYTEDNPYPVALTPANTWSTNNFLIWTPYKITNKSENIDIYISTRDYKEIIVNAGVRNKTLTKGILAEWINQLRPDTDFVSTTADNISIAIYLDGTYYINRTVIFDNSTKTNLFYNITLPQGKTLGWILFVVLIISIIGFQLGFEQHNIGSTIFQYGLIIITFIYPAFIYASITIILAKVMKLVKQVYSE